MPRRRHPHSRRLVLALLGLCVVGCARGGGGLALRNPMTGSLKESLSRLQHENQELEEELANARGESKRLARELESSEGRATDLASRLERYRGNLADAKDDGESLAEQYDPDAGGGTGRSTRASGRPQYKPPFTQIPNNRVEIPSSSEGSGSSRSREANPGPILDTPPVDYFDFDRDGRNLRSRSRSDPSPSTRSSSSGMSWKPVGGSSLR